MRHFDDIIPKHNKNGGGGGGAEWSWSEQEMSLLKQEIRFSPKRRIKCCLIVSYACYLRSQVKVPYERSRSALSVVLILCSP